MLLPEGKRELVTRIYSRFNRKIIWQGQVMKAKTALQAQVVHLSRYLLGKTKEYTPFALDEFEVS